MQNHISLLVSREDGPTLRAVFELGRPRIPIRVDRDGETTESEIHYSDLKPTIDRLLALRLPPWPIGGFAGIGFASTYSIRFEIGGSKSSYSWTLRPPTGWEPLQEILGTLAGIAQRRCEPATLEERPESIPEAGWWKPTES
jgi:hypothetical protein